MFKISLGCVCLGLISFVTQCFCSCITPTYDSYCLSGLTVEENAASVICSQYTLESSYGGCVYFINEEYNALPEYSDNEAYLYWNDYYNDWVIGPDYTAVGSTYTYWAYCSESRLDSCGHGDWYYYDGDDTSVRNSLTIYQCNYNNTECNNNLKLHSYEPYCFRNTNSRSVNDLGGKYTPMYNDSCIEEYPIYKHESHEASYSDLFTIWDILYNDIDLSTVLVRDEESNVWIIVAYEVAQYGTAFGYIAYCYKTNLYNCNKNWYIYNGNINDTDQDYLDTSVIFGKCNTCIDDDFIDFDQFCMIHNSGEFINGINQAIGRYSSENNENCYETLPYFRKVVSYDDNDSSDLSSSNGTSLLLTSDDDGDYFDSLIIHFDAEYELFFIDLNFTLGYPYKVEYGLTDLYVFACNDSNLTNCNQNNWVLCLWDDLDVCYENMNNVYSGVCSETVDLQCENSPLCYQIIDINDENSENSENGYLGYYDYLECDSNGYVMYIKNDTIINQTDGNIISQEIYLLHFFENDNYFYITDYGNYSNKYLGCNSLMLDYCENSWLKQNESSKLFTIYDSNIASISYEQYSCAIVSLVASDSNNNNNIDDLTAIIIILCIVGALLIFGIFWWCWKRNQTEKNIIPVIVETVRPTSARNNPPKNSNDIYTPRGGGSGGGRNDHDSNVEIKYSNDNDYFKDKLEIESPKFNRFAMIDDNWWKTNETLWTCENEGEMDMDMNAYPNNMSFGRSRNNNGTMMEPPKELLEDLKPVALNANNNIIINNNDDNDNNDGMELMEGEIKKTKKDNIRFLEYQEWELWASRGKNGKIKGQPMLYNKIEKKHYFPHFDDRTRAVAKQFGLKLPPKRKEWNYGKESD